jgi:two-component system, NtrC family, sensor kinase
MRRFIRHIATRFALLLAVAAVLPLIAYGIVSILSLQRGTRREVMQGNQNVATRAAEEIRRYIVTNAELLKALAATVQDTGITAAQQDRILKNSVLQIHEFREISLFAEDGRVLATSRVGRPRVAIPKDAPLFVDDVAMSGIRFDEDQLPTTLFAIHLMRLREPAGWLVGQFSLEEMWRTVDRVRIGSHGYAMVLAPNGELIAHGDPDKKALVAQARNMSGHPLVTALRAARGSTGPLASEYTDENGRQVLGVAQSMSPLAWTIIVEQPTAEAYANASILQRQLIVTISIALLLMISVGYMFGRQFIGPILTLQRGTNALAAGRLEERVDIRTGDEFAELGQAFNTMADKLIELQENIKRQERQAMFGRVAAGIVHDLSHPVQNIGNSTRLLLRDDLDPESRVEFHATIERELAALRRFMDDLRNVVRPRPVERFIMDVNASVSEIVEPMKTEGERNGITVESRYADGPLLIEGDRFALGRVYRNLVTNALQATEAGGHVTVSTSRVGDHVEISVADTGSGIPADRLSAIFEDFVTTKRRGLGLGLAISKRIVEQLGGTISVESEIGRGTTFTMRFPARDDQSALAS